jgi:hypothetical protein
MKTGSHSNRLLLAPQVFLGPGLVTALMWLSSLGPVTVIQLVASFLLLFFAWWSYWHWQQTGSRGLPLFAAITGMYWAYFGVPLFWGDRIVLDWRHPGRLLTDASITQAMLLVIFGVVFLWLGMRSKLGRRAAPKHLPEISVKPSSVVYLQIIAILGTLMTMYGGLPTVGGEGWRQVIVAMQGTVALTAVVILFRRALEGKAGALEKLSLGAILTVRLFIGVSTGWMGSAVSLGLACALVYLRKNHKLPIVAMACLLPYVLFFQAGKKEFRGIFWYGQVEGSAVQKVAFWVDASYKNWQIALEDPSGKGVPTLLALALSRTSLLTQGANVIEQTPALVPYQYGRLYSYLAVALIPRLLWPGKPSMNEANQFYQVAYGVTRERNLDRVSIAVGSLVEGYINFGWFGTALVMFLIGVFLDFWNETFLSRDVWLALGLGLAMVPELLLVEFQMAQYASGIVQHVLLTFVVFAPISYWPKRVSAKVAGRPVGGMVGVRP